MKKYYIPITVILCLLLIYTRFTNRLLNPFWTDELEVLDKLISIQYLFSSYLPFIPGGSPGFYLLLFPFKYFFGTEKLIIGIPGLISHMIVFFLIPKIVRLLFHRKDYSNGIISSIVRLGFVLDPTLSFQAMEIRPYAFLPLIWCTSVLVIYHLIDMDIKSFRYSLVKRILLICILFIIFNWHYYGFIMSLSIYFYFLFCKKFTLLFVLKRISVRLFVFIFLISIPIWKYFVSGSFKFNFNTFEWLNKNLINIYLLNNSTMQRSMIQQISFMIFIFILMAFFTRAIVMVLWKKTLFDFKQIAMFLRMFLFLIIFPIFFILILDLLNHYWFLYRQIAWTAIPVYIAIGIFISSLIEIKKKSVNQLQ